MYEKTTLGRSGLKVCRIGIGSSYGIGTKALEAAFEKGVNYFYWGSARTEKMGRAIRNLRKNHREELVVAVQVYLRDPLGLRVSVDMALKQLKLDYSDVLLLGWHNKAPKGNLLDEAQKLKEKGKVKALAISSHDRPLFESFITDPRFDIIMTRYNAVHLGCEKEVFPLLPESRDVRPGVITYTTTRWGHLLNPKRMPEGEQPPRGRDCYRFVLSHPDVDMALCGPKDEDQLNEALCALEEGPMNEEELERMRRIGDHIHGQADTGVFFKAMRTIDQLLGGAAK